MGRHHRRQDIPPAPPPRRTPRQRRSLGTVDALLGATATLLDEVGYPALTTKAIAARAGTSIGAFYQFFGNKDDAIAELVGRYRGNVRQFLVAAVPPTQAQIGAAWVRTVISGLREIYSNMPGFRGVWQGRPREARLGALADELRREVFSGLDDALSNAFPHVTAAARHRALTVTLETARALLAAIDDRDAATAEIERLLTPYLAGYFNRA